MGVGFEGAPKGGLDDLDDKQQSEMENVWAALEQQAGKFDAASKADWGDSAAYDGEKNVRIDEKGEEHARSESEFDTMPRQKGESAEDYGIRLKWQHEAEKIISETPRNENEDLESYNARVKSMIPSLEEFRAGIDKAENTNATQEKTVWDTLSPQEQNFYMAKLTQDEKHSNWRIDEANNRNFPEADKEQILEKEITAEEAREALLQTLTSSADKKDELSRADWDEHHAEMDASSTSTHASIEQTGRTIEEIKQRLGEKETIKNDTILFLQSEDAQIVQGELGDLEGKTNEELARLKAEIEEKIESETKKTLGFIRSRDAVKYYNELGIKASELEGLSLHELVAIQKQIEDRIDNMSEEERIAKNRDDLRSRKYAKFLIPAGIDPRKIDDFSAEELAIALGTVEHLYEIDRKRQESTQAAVVSEIGNKPKPTGEAITLDAENIEKARAIVHKIGSRAIEVAKNGGDATAIIEAAKDAAKEIQNDNQIEKAQEIVDNYNKRLEEAKQEAFRIRQERNNASGFFRRRKLEKELAAAEDEWNRAAKMLESAIARRDNIKASQVEQKAA